MLLVNPYYTIFNENNWYRQNDTIYYSDENITVTDPILNIPFKNDKNYNKKILFYLDKFLQTLQMRLRSNETAATIIYIFDDNEINPVNAKIVFGSNNTIQVLKN